MGELPVGIFRFAIIPAALFANPGHRRLARQLIAGGVPLCGGEPYPRTAIDCIACAVMPTATWLMSVAMQNRITRSCAVSFVVSFATAYSIRQLWAKAYIAASTPLRRSPCRQRQSLSFELTYDR
jgi:hypothetical protein